MSHVSGFCFKLIVEFCANHKVPYNFTAFPNHVINMNQHQAEQVCILLHIPPKNQICLSFRFLLLSLTIEIQGRSNCKGLGDKSRIDGFEKF